MDMNSLAQNATATLVAAAWKVAGAAVLWFVGRWLINLATGLVARAMSRQHFDTTLTRYLLTGLTVVLNVALVVAILGFFGVETTTFAALIAAGGVAIGVAWGGLLANFAAGAFLVFRRPFKVGDVVTAGGVTGTVDAIGLFGTTINTPDNVQTIIGNNKVFSDTIQNFSANPYRRVDLTAVINGTSIITRQFAS
jgi:small conductance mechanosensitive channel